MNCPKCDAEMERQNGEPDVGLEDGWACPVCGHFELSERDDEPPWAP